MHHFIYPTQDAYLSNKSTEIDKNFGLDELLVVGISQSYAKVVSNSKTYHFGNEYVSGMNVESYTGNFTGSFYGSSTSINGTIIGSSNLWIGSYFSGSVTGSLNGFETGSALIGQFSGSLRGFYGTLSTYAVNGWVSGSITSNCFSTFTGTLTNATGSLTGYLTGDEIRSEMNTQTLGKKFINRSLLKFDLTTISESIVSGEISNPKFFLKMYVTEARELPVEYKMYVFPISQSWVQGNGYFSDDGSDTGVSWNWRDRYSGSAWFSPYRTNIITSSVDYLEDYGYVSESFTRGGGTWYNIPCVQSYSYESADLDLEVTPIVNAWLQGSIPNQGLIVMCSEETSPSGSNAHVFFFSRETNTIYSPRLDVAWDDQVYITGSFGTGSVDSVTIPGRISGSMSSGISITNFLWTGSIDGFCGLVLSSDGQVLTGSYLDVHGKSGTVSGVDIRASIVGTSSFVDTDGYTPIDVSCSLGDFAGTYVLGRVKDSRIVGQISGSFNEQFFLNHGISGSVPNTHEFLSYVTEYSPVIGSLVGNVSSGTLNFGIFQGIFKTGLFVGGIANIPFTGSNCFVTQSFTITSVNVTGSSFQSLDNNKPFTVVIQNLKNIYNFGDMPRIGVFSREKLPLKTFTKNAQQPAYVTPRLLPSSSFYAIKDNETEEFIVDFDNYTKISCDLDGHYFVLNTTALGVERYYRVLVRVVFDDGEVYTFDNNNVFKITR